MTAITYINASSQEQPVTPAAPLPATAIDGYIAATALIVTIGGGATPASSVSAPGKAIDVFNNTGTDLEYRRGAATVYFPIPNGTARLIPAIGGNANTIGFRRIDQAATTVTLALEVLA